jgi:predicted acetyltransferase
MTLEYRRPSTEEGIVTALGPPFGAFGEEMRPYDAENLPKLMPVDRVLCAFDGDRAVGTTAAYPEELTIPGGFLKMGGVTWVGVLPSHRRRGVMSELISRQLRDLHERGEPLAGLWASESAIYGRFGYGLGAPSVSLHAEKANFRLRGDPEPVGSVRLVDRAEARAVFPQLHERLRRAVPGMLSRRGEYWDIYRLADEEFMREGYGPKFFALYERDGEPEAYATYRVKADWQDGIAGNELLVLEAFGITPLATRELWRFLFSLDLVAKVRANLFDPASPLPLLVTDPRRLHLRMSDGLWLRLVDVEAALRGRSYAADDAVVLEVDDGICEWNSGRFRVGTRTERTDDAPDLRLDVGDLASAYLGAFTFERLGDALRAEELTPGAFARATALFRTSRPPYCPEYF